MQLWLQWRDGPQLGDKPSDFRSLPQCDGQEIVQNWDAWARFSLSPFPALQQCQWNGIPFSQQSAEMCNGVFCTTLLWSFRCNELDRSWRYGRRCGHITAGFNWCSHCPDTISKDSVQDAALYWVITNSLNICHQTDPTYRKELDPLCA